MYICVFVMLWAGPNFSVAGSFAGSVMVALFIIVPFKMESDLRLLKVIDRLRKRGVFRLPDRVSDIAGLDVRFCLGEGRRTRKRVATPGQQEVC